MGRGAGVGRGSGGDVAERKDWVKTGEIVDALAVLGGCGRGSGGRDEGEEREEDAEGCGLPCCCSCMTVFTTHIGFVAVAVITPAVSRNDA